MGTERRRACPVCLDPARAPARLLAFAHPEAGVQLVKGRMAEGESPEAAALRELREESGLIGQIAGPAVELAIPETGEIWHLVPVHAPDAPAHWVHFCQDDGGKQFLFFWIDPDAPPPRDMGAPYARVLRAASAWR